MTKRGVAPAKEGDSPDAVSVDHNGLCFTCSVCGERVCHTWQGAESSTVDCPSCGTSYRISVSIDPAKDTAKDQG